jgi:hypothetical protein
MTARDSYRSNMNKIKSKLSALDWNRRLSLTEYTERRVTFGMHMGTMIKDLPTDYVKWGVLNLNSYWAEFFARELQRRDRSYR